MRGDQEPGGDEIDARINEFMEKRTLEHLVNEYIGEVISIVGYDKLYPTIFKKLNLTIPIGNI